DPPADMKTQARLRAGSTVGYLPAIAPGRKRAPEARRCIGADIDGAGLDRLAADVGAVTPHAVDRIPAVFPGLAQQLEAQRFDRDRIASRIDRDHLELGLAAFRNRIGAGRRAQ